MIEEIPELLEMYDNGVCSQSELFDRLSRLALRYEPGDVVSELREPLRSRFVHWLEQTFGNDDPIESFVVVGPGRSEDAARAVIPILRDWLRTRR